MAEFNKYFGDVLVGKTPEKVNVATALANKEVVGIYFSAHWCGPCRNFTPQLAEAYKKITSKGKPFEIVFVSSDQSEADFQNYYGSMPWLALPFQDERQDKLSSKFKIEGIPTLILLDKNGKVISRDGREIISSDPEGDKFPWPKQSVWELLGNSFINNKGETFTLDSLRANTALGLYFSAHWCPPCRGFTPKLAASYLKMNADGKKFEIIFLSSDKDEASFQEYFNSMPWKALPFSNREAKANLSRQFGVQGIPTLVILDPNTGNLITQDGRAEVEEDPEGLKFPWKPEPPKPLEPLIPRSADRLNSGPSLILFLDSVSSPDSVLASVTGAATEFFNKFKSAKPADDDEDEVLPLTFFYATKEHDPFPSRVRSFANIPDSLHMAILDIPSRLKYLHSGEITESSFTKFVQDFLNGSAASVSIKQ
jgi:nucleoredoxin